MSNYSYKQGANMAAMQNAAMPNANAMYGMQGGYTPYGYYGQSPYGTGHMATMQAAVPPTATSGGYMTPSGTNYTTQPSREESYVENILRLNRGKTATFYMTYENNREWNAKIFKGVIEAAGRDHIIISDSATGMRYLLLMLNLDYVTFDGPINYEYPFQGGVVTPGTPMS
nr:spore coat protein GerQ [Paenibacillus oryzae]